MGQAWKWSSVLETLSCVVVAFCKVCLGVQDIAGLPPREEKPGNAGGKKLDSERSANLQPYCILERKGKGLNLLANNIC